MQLKCNLNAVKLTFMWVKISEKKTSIFSVWDLFTMSKQLENNLFCH